jgi:hypothetical protein
MGVLRHTNVPLVTDDWHEIFTQGTIHVPLTIHCLFRPLEEGNA